MTNLGILRAQQHRLADSEQIFRETLEGQRRVLGPAHPDTLGNQTNLGWVLAQEGLVTESEQLLRATLKTAREALGAEHPFTLDAMAKLGGVCLRHGRVTEGEGLLQEALQIQSRVVPSDNPDRAWILAELGLAALKRGNPEVALDQLEAASAHGLTPDLVAAIRSDPAWAPLGANPRFGRWLARASGDEVSSTAVHPPE
jgi:tetratricopeptide (TPR) repeat protein